MGAVHYTENRMGRVFIAEGYDMYTVQYIEKWVGAVYYTDNRTGRVFIAEGFDMYIVQYIENGRVQFITQRIGRPESSSLVILAGDIAKWVGAVYYTENHDSLLCRAGGKDGYNPIHSLEKWVGAVHYTE